MKIPYRIETSGDGLQVDAHPIRLKGLCAPVNIMESPAGRCGMRESTQVLRRGSPKSVFLLVRSSLGRLWLPVEPITDPGFSRDVLRMLWIGLDLLPKALDEDSKVIDLVAIIRPPYGLQ